jgi:hypothetical protein
MIIITKDEKRPIAMEILLYRTYTVRFTVNKILKIRKFISTTKTKKSEKDEFVQLNYSNISTIFNLGQ